MSESENRIIGLQRKNKQITIHPPRCRKSEGFRLSSVGFLRGTVLYMYTIVEIYWCMTALDQLRQAFSELTFIRYDLYQN